ATPYNATRLSGDTAAKTNVNFQQDGSSDFNRYGVEAGIGLDWTLPKKNSLNFALSSNHFGNNSTGYLNQNQTTTDYSSNILSQILTLSNSNSHFRINEINTSLDYKKVFNKEDQELDFGVHSTFGSNDYKSGNEQYSLPEQALFYGTSSDNPGKESETELVVDYTEPFGKIKFGAGGKAFFRNINSNSDVLGLQPYSKQYSYDSTLSNSLHYTQQVYAVYTELGFPVGKLFETKLGLRYERTELSTFFSNASQQVPEPGYNTWLPSVFFIKKFENQSLKLSFGRRIERPNYRNLNPFINTTDPNNVTTGNPYLKPEQGYRIELGWTHELKGGGTFMVSLFDRINQDDIQPYVVYYAQLPVGDTVYKNVSVSTPQNIGTETNIGMNLFADIHPTTKFSLRSNFFMFHRNIVNAIDPGLNSESWNYRFNINLTYAFSGNLGAEFFGNFNSPRHELQGKYPSFTSYTFAIRQQIWKKKGSIAFTTNNPFNEYVNQTTHITGIGFSTTSTRLVPYRSFGINFTWKFGKLEFKKEKPSNPDMNTPNGEG
ncbi:MAG TPA: outer membrane beta-barrel family protein, partial [Puia sp.]